MILKAYRRMEAGVNPELELLRFLTEHGFASVLGPRRLVRLRRRAAIDATLGVVQHTWPAATGWLVALDVLREGRPRRLPGAGASSAR